ncbi:chemotaxis protein CheB [Paracidovorax citrulli]
MPTRDIIVLASSTGGLDVLRTLIGGLPHDLPAAVLLVQHIGAHESILPDILAPHSSLPVRHGTDGEAVLPGTIYIAPPDRHMLVRDNRIQLSRGPKENFTRPAADPLFRSVAIEYGKRVIGIVLTGELDDGSSGLVAIKACGGYTIVQDPNDAAARSMPASAMDATDVDAVVPASGLAPAIVAALSTKPALGEATMATRQHIQWETDMAATGTGQLAQLDAMGHRSPLTCPECGGTLWQLDGRPMRFRCHTGHAYTQLALQDHQDAVLEKVLWSAVRRLHERMATAHTAEAAARNEGDPRRASVQEQLVTRCLALEAELHRFIEQSGRGA